jgi:hypothetical protein
LFTHDDDDDDDEDDDDDDDDDEEEEDEEEDDLSSINLAFSLLSMNHKVTANLNTFVGRTS